MYIRYDEDEFVGKIYNNIEIIKFYDHYKPGKYIYRRHLCRCFCGVFFIAQARNIKSGAQKSCGCIRVHHGMVGTRIYKIWAAMLIRTDPKRVEKFPDYSGRGIGVCAEWRRFDNFLLDMAEGYSDHLTLDRIDNDKGYSKENCRWATMTQQVNNTRVRKNKISKFRGVTPNKKTGKWMAKVTIEKTHTVHIGTFETEEKAALAFDNYCITHDLDKQLNFKENTYGI